VRVESCKEPYHSRDIGSTPAAAAEPGSRGALLCKGAPVCAYGLFHWTPNANGIYTKYYIRARPVLRMALAMGGPPRADALRPMPHRPALGPGRGVGPCAGCRLPVHQIPVDPRSRRAICHCHLSGLGYLLFAKAFHFPLAVPGTRAAAFHQRGPGHGICFLPFTRDLIFTRSRRFACRAELRARKACGLAAARLGREEGREGGGARGLALVAAR
jgi:hypothetical protein